MDLSGEVLLLLVTSLIYGTHSYNVVTKKCLNKVLLSFDVDSLGEGDTPDWDDAQIRNLCKNWYALIPCITKDDKYSDPTTLLQRAEATVTELKALCGKDYKCNVYENLQMFKRMEISIKKCTRTAIKPINQVPATPEVKRDVCKGMDNSADCVGKYAGRCGHTAVVFAKGLLESYFEAPRKKLECSKYNPKSSTVPNIPSTTEMTFCTEEYIENKHRKCLKLLHPDVELSQIINDTKPDWTESQVNIICKNLHRYKPCPDRIFESCDIPRMKTMSKLVESVFDYVCREGLQTYVKVSSCLKMEKSTKNSIQECVERASDVNPKEFYQNGRYDEKKICKYMSEMAHYTEQAAIVCGHQAGDFLLELVGKTIQPYRIGVKCGSANTGAIIGITIGCIVFIIMILTVRYARKQRVFTSIPAFRYLK